MKTCKRCNTEKSIDCFSTNGKSGHHPVCKECRSYIAREDRIKNIERAREYDRNKYARTRDQRLAANKRYYTENRDKRLQQERERYARKSEHIKRSAQTYRIANREKVYEWNGTRRAQLRNSVPLWADRKEIAEVYRKEKSASYSTGVKHHVDHIIPLSGDLVCGLHVIENLQVITAEQNLRKSNRVDY